METFQTSEYTPSELHLAKKLQPLRLALKIAESLLSRGVSTRDTVSQALDVTERYCKERVYFDVNANVIIASQYRGLYKDPLTLMVTVRYDKSNNMQVQELQQLVRDIVKGLPLAKAISRYNKIDKTGKSYPDWVRMVGNAGMASGVVMLYTDSPYNIALTFLAACLVHTLIRAIDRRKVPPFFAQAIAAVAIVFLATIFTGLGEIDVWPFIHVNPTLIVVGCLMMLVAGLSLAATAQDAIDEYYVTAGARIVKTAMLTTGIIIGVLGGLMLVSEFTSITINTKQPPLPSPFAMQVIGAAITGAAWALYTQSSRAAIAWTAIISAGGFLIYSANSGALGEAFSSGVASFAIGFLASIVARFWKSPSIAIINSAIVILVPGFMLYRGLMHFVGNSPQQDFTTGMVITITAASVALAIAAGAALGTYVGRPVRSHMIRLYQYVPQLFVKPRK